MAANSELTLSGKRVNRVHRAAYDAAVTAIRGVQRDEGDGRPDLTLYRPLSTNYSLFNAQVVARENLVGDSLPAVVGDGMFWELDGHGDAARLEVTATLVPQSVMRRLLLRPELVELNVTPVNQQ